MQRKINALKHKYFTFEGWSRLAVLGAFALIGVLAALDLVEDLGQGTTALHVLAEGTVVAIALGGVVSITLHLLGEARTARYEAEQLSRRLAETAQSAREWRQEAQDLLRGLGASIGRQFDKWKLSPAEKEVALFLLKGLSHREIARFRGVSEATARQQARAVYKKAGISGRHDLAAFFLEDLVLPPSSE